MKKEIVVLLFVLHHLVVAAADPRDNLNFLDTSLRELAAQSTVPTSNVVQVEKEKSVSDLISECFESYTGFFKYSLVVPFYSFHLPQENMLFLNKVSKLVDRLYRIKNQKISALGITYSARDWLRFIFESQTKKAIKIFNRTDLNQRGQAFAVRKKIRKFLGIKDDLKSEEAAIKGQISVIGGNIEKLYTKTTGWWKPCLVFDSGVYRQKFGLAENEFEENFLTGIDRLVDSLSTFVAHDVSAFGMEKTGRDWLDAILISEYPDKTKIFKHAETGHGLRGEVAQKIRKIIKRIDSDIASLEKQLVNGAIQATTLSGTLDFSEQEYANSLETVLNYFQGYKDTWRGRYFILEKELQSDRSQQVEAFSNIMALINHLITKEERIDYSIDTGFLAGEVSDITLMIILQRSVDYFIAELKKRKPAFYVSEYKKHQTDENPDSSAGGGSSRVDWHENYQFDRGLLAALENAKKQMQAAFNQKIENREKKLIDNYEKSL